MDNFEPIDELSLSNKRKEGHEDRSTDRHGDFSDNISASSSLHLVWYLIPILGFFPSLWTLYRRQGSREQLATSRLSITLAIFWLLGYLFLATGSANLDFMSMRLLILNTFLTSSYFLVSLWLIFLTIQGKSKRLPVFSRFAEEVIDKYLS
ncbi:hypothetical protein [Fischerella sp. PCC 9605]|uniref:hypothetical protein n=1 Tax=Fischerella sp. PCC 9605 TaxID=1173024 RepID=UPI00047B1721|nr:hypothetical protein [Fischerella sp. PCC 9605]